MGDGHSHASTPDRVVEGFVPFVGQHCETTTLGCLLRHAGLELSEPMLFGLGEGLSFIYWKMKAWDFPLLGGRTKPDCVTAALASNLGLEMDVLETRSAKKAWSWVEQRLQAGAPVGLKLDCHDLEYFNTKIHFAGHYVAMYGVQEGRALLVDTAQQGGAVTTSLTSLASARTAKGPMSSPHRSFTLLLPAHHVDVRGALRRAIANNTHAYLNPAITNLAFKGIHKAATELVKWFDSLAHPREAFGTVATMMERAGTGGSLFRNLYRDFLKEAAELLDSPQLSASARDFASIALKWTAVSEALDAAAREDKRAYVEEAARLLEALAAEELAAMRALSEYEFG